MHGRSGSGRNRVKMSRRQQELTAKNYFRHSRQIYMGLKGVTAKLSMSLSLPGHTWVMESLVVRVIFFLQRFDSRAEFKRLHH